MSTTYTTNYHLGKQTNTSDVFNMSVITDNMDAIDTQMKSNENNILSIQQAVQNKKSVNLTLESGGFSTQGATVADNTKCRTKYYTSFSLYNEPIYFPVGTKHRFVYYREDRESTFISISSWNESTTDYIAFPTNETYACFKIEIAYTDGRIISAMPTIYFYLHWNDDNHINALNGLYVAADKPTVGKNDNFAMSPLIEIKAGKQYRAIKYRNTIIFDADLQPLRVLTSADLSNGIFTAETNDKYLALCWRKSDTDVMYFYELSSAVAGANIPNLVPTTLNGKKLSLLGDSISAYTGTIPTGNEAYYTGNNSGVSDACQMWWNVLCSRTGMIPLVINGWSGSGITQLTDSAHSGKTPMSATSRCQALNAGTTTPDIILIAGGVNDYTYAEQSSQTPSNWDGTTAPVDGNSFDETYAVMIKNIQTAYPNAVVVCLSTWFSMRGTDNGYTLTNGEGLTQTDYDKAIEKVANLMRVPYINVEKCGFNRSNFYPTYAEDSSTIPTHPNKNGQKVMGEYLANVLPEIVKGFVG